MSPVEPAVDRCDDNGSKVAALAADRWGDKGSKGAAPAVDRCDDNGSKGVAPVDRCDGKGSKVAPSAASSSGPRPAASGSGPRPVRPVSDEARSRLELVKSGGTDMTPRLLFGGPGWATTAAPVPSSAMTLPDAGVA